MKKSVMVRRLAIPILVLGLAACSVVKIMYGMAGDLMARQVAFHLDLDEADQAFLDAGIADIVRWHRTHMLPRYADFLRRQADFIDRGLMNRERIAASLDAGRLLLVDTLKGVTPQTAGLLARHTAPAKLAYFSDRLAERRAERLEELNEPQDERLEDRARRIARNFERFTGDLGAAQKEIIRRYAEFTLDDQVVRFRSRERRQKLFIEFLEKRPRAAEIKVFMESLILRPQDFLGPQYKTIAEKRLARFRDLLLDVLTSLAPTQHARVSRTLRSYADDFMDLAE